ncbi:MAG: right-handed parallel beta-helix repeat-containing protein, partial [Planctomycetota bacterium]
MKKLVFIFIYLLPVMTLQAATITVDDDGPADFNNIPAAINASEHGDTIVVKAGRYDRRISFNNMAVTLTSEDPDDPNIVRATIITADSDYSVSFDFEEGNSSILTGFTITGRGIRCYGTSPTISKNVITNCGSYGIHGENDAAPVILENTISFNGQAAIYRCNGPITNNVISANRGGIAYCDGPITDNIISDNSDSDLGRGGGLSFCKGLIAGNLIAYNYASYKGGAAYECPGDIKGNIIVGNTSAIAGGGLCNCRGEITNNIIAGNRSDNGGGLFGCTHIRNNTVVGNAANGNGGAMGQCPGHVSSNIIAFNRAGFVGGVHGASSNSYNAFWSNEGGNFGSGAFAGPGDIIADPLFASDGHWDANGTTVEGDVTSMCIDAGEPGSDWTAELWPHGRHINIGAYGGTAQASMSLSDAGNPANLNPDMDDVNDWVDHRDLSLLTDKWLNSEVPLAEDLNRDGVVDFADYAILMANWQPEPPAPQPPIPDPMTWKEAPHATSRTTIVMSATIAVSTDGSAVEYYFESTMPGGHDSGWQNEPD